MVQPSHETTVRPRLALIQILMLVVMAAGVVSLSADPDGAPSDGPATFAARWASIDGGGGTVDGGGWTLASALGQPDAAQLADATWKLDGGFVIDPPPAEPPLFADGFETGTTGAWGSTNP